MSKTEACGRVTCLACLRGNVACEHGVLYPKACHACFVASGLRSAEDQPGDVAIRTLEYEAGIREQEIESLRKELRATQINLGRANNARQAAEAETKGAPGTRGMYSHKKRVRQLCRAAIAYEAERGISANALLDAAQNYGAAVLAGRRNGSRKERAPFVHDPGCLSLTSNPSNPECRTSGCTTILRATPNASKARHPFARGQIVEIRSGKRAGQRHPVLDVFLAYEEGERAGVSIREGDTELFYGLDEVSAACPTLIQAIEAEDPELAAELAALDEDPEAVALSVGLSSCKASELFPLAVRIGKGRQKYPTGCTLLSLLDEAGEVAHAVNKRESHERVRDELLDVAAVAMRLYFGEIDTAWQPSAPFTSEGRKP